MQFTVYVPQVVEIPDEDLAKIHAGVLLQRELRRLPSPSANVLTSELIGFAAGMGIVDEFPAGAHVDAAEEFPWSSPQLDEAALAGRCSIPLAEYIDRLAAAQLEPGEIDHDCGGEA